MKICVLTSSFPRFAGDFAGVFVYKLYQKMVRRDIEVDVVCPHDHQTPLFEERDGLRIHRFPYFWPLRLQKLAYGVGIINNLRKHPWTVFQIPLLLFCQWKLADRVIRTYGSDLIHFHWTIPQGLPAIGLQHMHRLPAIGSIHGSDVFGLQNPLANEINGWIIRKSAWCTANSTATAKRVGHISNRQQVQIIPMGVDIDQFADSQGPASENDPSHPDRPKILYVGRLIRWKGVAYLLKAFARVVTHWPKARLVIAGMGQEKAHLMKMAADVPF